MLLSRWVLKLNLWLIPHNLNRLNKIVGHLPIIVTIMYSNKLTISWIIFIISTIILSSVRGQYFGQRMKT